MIHKLNDCRKIDKYASFISHKVCDMRAQGVAHVYKDVQADHPGRKYFFGERGYPSHDQILVSYQKIHYHLAEWDWANVKYVFIFYLIELILM